MIIRLWILKILFVLLIYDFLLVIQSVIQSEEEMFIVGLFLFDNNWSVEFCYKHFEHRSDWHWTSVRNCHPVVPLPTPKLYHSSPPPLKEKKEGKRDVQPATKTQLHVVSQTWMALKKINKIKRGWKLGKIIKIKIKELFTKKMGENFLCYQIEGKLYIITRKRKIFL